MYAKGNVLQRSSENHGESEGTIEKNVKMICESRTDEGLRTFKDGCCGTIRTIAEGGGQTSD